MSKGFVREQDGEETFEELPDRPVSQFPNFVTAEGLAQIEAEIERFREETAAAQKAEDRAALARASRDLRYWLARRANAELVEPHRTKEVRFGSTVTIEREDGRHTYRIVGEDEADPTRGTLSHASPLARALIGKKAGDSATVNESEIDIIEVR